MIKKYEKLKKLRKTGKVCLSTEVVLRRCGKVGEEKKRRSSRKDGDTKRKAENDRGDDEGEDVGRAAAVLIFRCS